MPYQRIHGSAHDRDKRQTFDESGDVSWVNAEWQANEIAHTLAGAGRGNSDSTKSDDQEECRGRGHELPRLLKPPTKSSASVRSNR